jgi:hypothetical protein
MGRTRAKGVLQIKNRVFMRSCQVQRPFKMKATKINRETYNHYNHKGTLFNLWLTFIGADNVRGYRIRRESDSGYQYSEQTQEVASTEGDSHESVLNKEMHPSEVERETRLQSLQVQQDLLSLPHSLLSTPVSCVLVCL